MKVLIIKTSSLGDIIQAFPVLDYFHTYYPDAQIDWVVEKPFSELIEAHPYVHQVFTIQTKKWKKQGFLKSHTRREIQECARDLHLQSYDRVFDLQGNIKSGLVTAIARAPIKVGFGYASVPESPNILFTNHRFNPPQGQNIREDYLFLVQSAMKNFKTAENGVMLRISEEEEVKVLNLLRHPNLRHGKKIMVCCGSNWVNKQLKPETLGIFLESIQKELNSSFLFVWGSQEEKNIVEELTNKFPTSSLVAEKLALPTLQNVMAKMDLVISMDSLPLHLAGTTSTPTYSIFGPSLAHKYKPVGMHHESFQGICPYDKQFVKRCPLLRTCATGSCMRDVEAKKLFDHFMDWFKDLRRS